MLREIWRHVTMVELFVDDNKTNDNDDRTEGERQKK